MYSMPNDISRCTQIVIKHLAAKEVVPDDASANHIAQRVLALIYATGGNYSNESLEE